MPPEPETTEQANARKNVRAQFEAFLKQTYADPPSGVDAHPAVRGQYRQLRAAFDAGFAHGIELGFTAVPSGDAL